jgi:putative hydrolase of the HAD superfamily
VVFRVLGEHKPGHEIEHDHLRDRLRNTFPWHDYETPHLELNEPDAWWTHVTTGIDDALVGIGIDGATASGVARECRERLMDPSTWEVFPDTAPALRRTREAGRRNVVLSNHGPELEDVVAGVGLADLIDDVITSARAGYEKPHPGIFRVAHETISPRDAWMVGDNPLADVAGAESAGINAILVRVKNFDKRYAREVERYWPTRMFPNWRNMVGRRTEDLNGAVDIILSGD